MNALEVNLLLTKAALLDPFIVPDADRAEEWAELLDEVTLAEAIAAMREHYRTETGRLMPAHILALVPSTPEPVVPDITAEFVEESKRAALAAAGVTEAQWEAHKTDRVWLEAHFPQRELEAGE